MGTPYKMKGSPMARNFGVGSPMRNDDKKSKVADDEYKVEDYAAQHNISEDEVKKHLQNLNVAEGDTMISYRSDNPNPNNNPQKIYAANKGRYAYDKSYKDTDRDDVVDSYGGFGSKAYKSADDSWRKSVDWDKESKSSTGETFFSVPKLTFHGSKKTQMKKNRTLGDDGIIPSELQEYYKKRGF